MRIVLGVLIAFVSMSIVVFAVSVAPWFLLGLDRVLQPGHFDTTSVLNVYAVLVGVLGAVLAGWLCATIARSWIAVISLAVLCFVGGAMNAFAQRAKAEPGKREPGLSVSQAIARRKEPAWFTFLMPCIGAGDVLLGGRRARQVRQSVDP